MEQQQTQDSGFIEKIVHLNRVAKVVKGGRRFSFSALVVVGDGNGNVGYGLGKAQEVPEALRKATERARKTMVKIPLLEGTLPYEVLGRFGAGRVLLKPASRGTGIIAGGAVRAVMEAAGVTDVLAKAIGTNNPHNGLRAAIDGRSRVRSARQETGSPPQVGAKGRKACPRSRSSSSEAVSAAPRIREKFWIRWGCAVARWSKALKTTPPFAAWLPRCPTW